MKAKVRLLPAGRDLRFASPCRVKRFLALAAEEPDWFAEASAEVWKQEEAGISAAARRTRGYHNDPKPSQVAKGGNGFAE